MMPLTELDMSHEDMKRIAADSAQVCAECGGTMAVAWGGAHSYDCYILRCGKDVNHNGYIRERREAVYPGSHIGVIPVKEYRQLEKEYGRMTTTALARYAGKQALTKAEVTDIVATLWPEAPDLERAKAIAYCVSYQLNPLAKHLYLVEYGKTWTLLRSIQADRLIASRSGRYGYLDDTPRAATVEEAERQYGDAAEKIAKANYVGITKLKDGEGFTASGFGLWPKDKPPKGTDKGNTPQNMANIHSERQALDRLRPGEMPQNIEVVDAEYEEVPGVGQVDMQTGEIAAPEEPSPEPVEVSDNAAKPQPSGSTQNSRDSKPILAWYDLQTAVKEDFGMSMNDAQFLLGVTNWKTEEKSPAECYRLIVEAKRDS